MDHFFGAVITGDVNASSRLPSEQARRLASLLESCFTETATALPAAELTAFTGFRGDGWQFALRRPEFAMRAALHFRGRLLVRSWEEFARRLHSSAAVGFGTIEYLPDETTTSGGGEAYERSGHRLDRMHKRMPGMGVAASDAFDAACLDALLGVVDALVRQWTVHQAAAVSLAMQGWSQTEIAQSWDPTVSQQAIHKHLAGAGWPALEPALNWEETTLKGCFSKNNL